MYFVKNLYLILITKIIVKQNEAIMESLAKQKVLAERVLHQENENNNLRSVFPINSVEELKKIDTTICEENRDLYINIMKSLLKGRLPKTFTDVISTRVCMDVNVDGVHGKKRLKDFKVFYHALKDACRSLGSDEPEIDIRNSLKIIKKRFIHSECVKNKKKK
ncbi:hypothetical protein CVS40_8793 [Lucilia cuprina]|nr:hypothetical protein CVS40_8793 [Lucilia cuprina]